MFFTNALILAGAAFVAANPAPASYPKGSTSKTATPGTFEVSNFSYGCTTTCSYSFDVKVKGAAGANHPAVKKTVKCSGTDASKDYVKCAAFSDSRSIGAYIVKGSKSSPDTLKLEYVVHTSKDKATYTYTGQKAVYAATGPQAKKQKKSFSVKETAATGVA